VSAVQSPLGLPFPPAAQRSGWLRRSAELASRARELLETARTVLGSDIAIAELETASAGRSAEIVSTLTWLCIDRLRGDGINRTTTAAVCSLVSDLQRLALELYEHEMATRSRRVAGMEACLGRLRAMSTSADLIDRVCEEVSSSCGFGRVVLSRVEDGQWRPWMRHFVDPAVMGDDNWFDVWLQTSIPLDEMTLETRLLTERRAELVHDTSASYVHPMIRAGLSNSYVATPIMPAGNVVGFLHADHHPTDRHCDETDRDVLWAFAEGFGHIYERTVLLERLRSQREQVRATLADVDAAMTELCDSEIELASKAEEPSTLTRAAVSAMTATSDNFADLTPREREVLELMVAGAKNQAIAERLVITEGTVKSHVKHILRKIGAVNRSQAIAYYMGIAHEDL